MRIKMCLICSSFIFVMGCHSKVEEEVRLIECDLAELPDAWEKGWVDGAYKNNYSILKRALNVANVSERIRLVRHIRTHFWHDPRWYVTNCSNEGSFDVRISFIEKCGIRLRSSASMTPELIHSSWKMQAELLDLFEEVFRLTDHVWNNGEYREPLSSCKNSTVPNLFHNEHTDTALRGACEEMYQLSERSVWDRGMRGALPDMRIREGIKGQIAHYRRYEAYMDQWNLARDWHHRYERFFKYCCSFTEDYRILPPEYRPAFVKQIQRDFFQRPGMAYVDWDAIPEDFKKGIEVPSAVKAARKKEKDAKSPTGNVK